MGKFVVLLTLVGVLLATQLGAKIHEKSVDPAIQKYEDKLPGFLSPNLSSTSLEILRKHATRKSSATKSYKDESFMPTGPVSANQTNRLCQIQVKTDLHHLVSADEIFDYFQRKADVLQGREEDASSWWIMEPVGLKGMFKLRNKLTNEYLTSFIPWYDEGIFDHSVPVTSKEHLECDYYYLWKTTLLPDGYRFLQHNATDSYIASILLDDAHFTMVVHENDELKYMDEYRWRITCTESTK